MPDNLIDRRPYLKGKRLYSDETGTKAEIFEIKNKPGYIAKELKIPPNLEKLEDIKHWVEEDLGNFKKYLGAYLPDYYIVYGHGKHGITAYMFMEQVQSTELDEGAKQQFSIEFDDFIAQCEAMYFATFNNNTHRGTTYDVNNKSNIFGKTLKNPALHLYLTDIYSTVHAQPDALADSLEILIKNLEQEYKYIFKNTHKFIHKLRKIPN